MITSTSSWSAILRLRLDCCRSSQARNRWMISQYEDLSFLNVRARMAKLLLELSDFGSVSIDRREYSINDMAARVATVPEAVSRTLRYFREKDWVTSSRMEIIVIHPDELAGVAQLEFRLFVICLAIRSYNFRSIYSLFEN